MIDALSEEEARRLLAEAKRGHLAADELDRIVAALDDPDASARRYTLLHIVGKGGGQRYRRKVEGYLDSPGDPMLARLALQILCRFWGLARDYLPELRHFVSGVEWDDEDDVRQVAVFEAGEFLAEGNDDALGAELLRLAADDDENPVMRRAAVRSLARAVGVAPPDMPSAVSHPRARGAWEMDVIRRARSRFAAS